MSDFGKSTSKSSKSIRESLKYVLITAARNEEKFLEMTIRSVIRQTLLPAKWIIVSDGSTDGTDEIAKRYAALYGWIDFMRMPPRAERHFGGKALAFNSGYEKLKGFDYDIIGNLDADITFDSEYFSFLLSKFADDPNLGVAGTPFVEGSTQYDYRFSRKEHVSGACQLFRRECFQSIGGYVPREAGGIDLVAVVTARMKHWKTQTFTEKESYHHRPQGTAGRNLIKYSFKSGHGDYVIGVHPAWQFLRSIYQMSRRPLFLSGFLLLAGYAWGMLLKPGRPVSREFIHFRKKEQSQWLREYYKKAIERLK